MPKNLFGKVEFVGQTNRLFHTTYNFPEWIKHEIQHKIASLGKELIGFIIFLKNLNSTWQVVPGSINLSNKNVSWLFEILIAFKFLKAREYAKRDFCR